MNRCYALNDTTAQLIHDATIDTAIWLKEEHPEDYERLLAAAETLAAQNPDLRN